MDRPSTKDIRIRRRWICSIGAGIVAAPLRSLAQHAGKVWPVGDTANRTPASTRTEASPSDPLPVFTPARAETGAITNYSSLPLNAWHQLDGSAMTQLQPLMPPGGEGNLKSVLAEWGSAALDPATSDMHFHGSGHGGRNSGWYTFNIRTGKWRVTSKPAVLGEVEQAWHRVCAKYLYPGYPPGVAVSPTIWKPASEFGGPPDWIMLVESVSATPIRESGVIVDFKPRPTMENIQAVMGKSQTPFHCWGKITWVPWMGANGGIFCPKMRCYMWYPDSDTIQLLGWMMRKDSKSPHNNNWQFNHADPVTRKIYGMTNIGTSERQSAAFREYDPIAPHKEVWQAYVSYPAIHTFDRGDCICAADREIVHFALRARKPPGSDNFVFASKMQAFNMDTKVWRSIPITDPPFVRGDGEWSMVYVGNNKVLITQNKGRLYSINIQTGAGEAHPTVGRQYFDAPSAGNGLYGKLQYFDGILIAVPDVNNVRVMRVG